MAIKLKIPKKGNPMRTLLIGCGAVGIGIAASLYDSQVPLDLVARGETKKAIELKGIKRTGLLKEVTIPAEQIQIYETIKEIQNKSFDVILICTKTTQSEGIFMELSEAPHLLAAGGKIVLVQNGLDDEEMVLKYFKKQQVYSARVFIGFTRPELQISEVTVFSSGLLIGNLYGCEIEGLLPLALAIDQGGMPCKVVADIAKNIWAKMLYNCALNPLGAILGARRGALL